MAFKMKNPFGQKAVDKSSPELMERGAADAAGGDGPAEVVQYNESDFERNTESNVADRVAVGDADGDGAADRVTVRGWDPEKKEERSVTSGSDEQADEESLGIAIGDPGVNGNLAADGDGGAPDAMRVVKTRSNIQNNRLGSLDEGGDEDGTPDAMASSFNSSKSGVYRTGTDDGAVDGGVTHEDDWEAPAARTAAHEAAHTVQQSTAQGASDIQSPRDAASGMASGRVQQGDVIGDGSAAATGPVRLDPTPARDADIDGDPADAQKNWLPSSFRREATDPTDDNTDADDLPNAAYDVQAPRDVATGQSSGRMASTEGRPTYDVKNLSKREGVPTQPSDDPTDADSSAEGGTSYRESPTRASLGRREDMPGDPSTGDTPDPEAVSLNGLPPGMPVEGSITDVPETAWPSDDRISTNTTIERQTPKRDFGDRQMEEGGGEDDPNVVYDVKAPRDTATGQSSGREGGPRQTTSQDGIAVNEEGSSNIGSSAQENGTLDFQRDPNIGSSGQDGIAIDVEGVQAARLNGLPPGIPVEDDMLDEPSTLLDLSAVTDGGGAVAIADLDADGLPDMADFDTDYDADGIEADDLMVGP